MSQDIEVIVSRQVNDLRAEMRAELDKLRKELLSEITYSNRNLEKKIEGLNLTEKKDDDDIKPKKNDEYDLSTSTSFNWVKKNMSELTFQQTVDFFKKVLQSSNVECESVKSREFGQDKGTFYRVLDSVWDQIVSNLNDNSGDIYKACIKGVASFISNLGSK